MLKKLLTNLGIISLLFSIGMGDNYKIQDFLPDSLTTWQIYATGEFSGNRQYQENSYDDENTDTDYRIKLNPEIRYRYRKLRHNYTMNYNFITTFQKEKSEQEYYTELTEGRFTNFDISGDLKHHKYFDQYGIIGNIAFNYAHENHDRTITYEDTEDNYRDYEEIDNKFRLTLTPGISRGRIYSGSYGAKTDEIIRKLQSAGLLNRDLTKKEFLEFSRKMLSKRAQFHFDSRIKKIETLRTMIDYLKEKNIIDNTNLDAILIAEDIYSYDLPNFLLPRKFGYQLYLTPIITYDIFSFDREETIVNGNISVPDVNNSSAEFISYGAKAGIDYSKILNWNLFFNSSFSIAYQQQDETREDDNISVDYSANSLLTQLSFDLYYQFSSRSFLKCYNSFYYDKNKRSEDGESVEKIDEWYRLRSGLDFVYFITPKFSLNTGITGILNKYWFDWEPNNKSGKFKYSTNFSVKLKYYF